MAYGVDASLARATRLGDDPIHARVVVRRCRADSHPDHHVKPCASSYPLARPLCRRVSYVRAGLALLEGRVHRPRRLGGGAGRPRRRRGAPGRPPSFAHGVDGAVVASRRGEPRVRPSGTRARGGREFGTSGGGRPRATRSASTGALGRVEAARTQLSAMGVVETVRREATRRGARVRPGRGASRRPGRASVDAGFEGVKLGPRKGANWRRDRTSSRRTRRGPSETSHPGGGAGAPTRARRSRRGRPRLVGLDPHAHDARCRASGRQPSVAIEAADRARGALRIASGGGTHRPTFRPTLGGRATGGRCPSARRGCARGPRRCRGERKVTSPTPTRRAWDSDERRRRRHVVRGRPSGATPPYVSRDGGGRTRRA